jgi:hypothetical protein
MHISCFFAFFHTITKLTFIFPQEPVVRKFQSTTSQQLVYKHGNIFTQFLSESIEVLFSKLLKQTEVQMYADQNRGLNFNPGLALIQL